MVKTKTTMLYLIQSFICFLALVVSFVLFNIVSFISFFAQVVRKIYRSEDLRDYFKVCAIGEDQRGGSYLYGTEDFTISSYTYYLHSQGNVFASYFMKFIDFFAHILGDGKQHCKRTYEKESFELKNGGATASSQKGEIK